MIPFFLLRWNNAEALWMMQSFTQKESSPGKAETSRVNDLRAIDLFI